MEYTTFDNMGCICLGKRKNGLNKKKKKLPAMICENEVQL